MSKLHLARLGILPDEINTPLSCKIPARPSPLLQTDNCISEQDQSQIWKEAFFHPLCVYK